MKKILSVLMAIGLIFTTSLNGYAQEILRVGTEPTFAPFEFLDSKNNKFAGYDIDLIEAVSKKLGKKVEVNNMGFDALVPAVMTGVVEVVASGMSITPARAKRVAFSDPYYEIGIAMLVRRQDANQYQSVEQLKGKKIGVQIGTTAVDLAKKEGQADVIIFNTNSEAFLALATGGVDAVLMDKPVIAYFLKQQPKMAKKLFLQPKIYESSQLGLAVAKNNPELLKSINEALRTMKASGELDLIYNKWFAS